MDDFDYSTSTGAQFIFRRERDSASKFFEAMGLTSAGGISSEKDSKTGAAKSDHTGKDVPDTKNVDTLTAEKVAIGMDDFDYSTSVEAKYIYGMEGFRVLGFLGLEERTSAGGISSEKVSKTGAAKSDHTGKDVGPDTKKVETQTV